MTAREANFDGIIGPTHNYAGLSPGNIASERNGGAPSSPKRAALQGLAKARRLADLGVDQHVLPPLDRPSTRFLRQLGFTGSDHQVIADAAAESPHELAAACSASAMWAANAATISPSADTADGRLHLSPANLAFNAHRSIEAETMSRALRQIFADPNHFTVHDPLPATPRYFDEGAASHTRLTTAHGEPGLELFVYGRPACAKSDLDAGTTRFPARQSEGASRALARRHRLDPARTLLLDQSPRAIDAGVFHNDVISVGNENVLMLHEHAYADTPAALERIRARFPGELHVFLVTDSELTLEQAAATYLFNSQLVTTAPGRMTLIAPTEARDSDAASACADRLVREIEPVEAVEYVDVRESMRNGGGPACLRLRVVMTETERRALAGRTQLDDRLYEELVNWIERHYRETLHPADLADPMLLRESHDALDELTRILGLRPLYGFQTEPGSHAFPGSSASGIDRPCGSVADSDGGDDPACSSCSAAS